MPAAVANRAPGEVGLVIARHVTRPEARASEPIGGGGAFAVEVGELQGSVQIGPATV